MGRVLRDFDHHAEYLPGRGGIATYDGPQSNLISIGNTPISQGMQIAGGVVSMIDPEKGFQVQMADGKQVWIPSNINPRLIPYLNGNKLDLDGAIKAGIDTVQDYGGLGITQTQIDAIKSGAIYSDVINQNNEQNKIVIETKPETNQQAKQDAKSRPVDTLTNAGTQTGSQSPAPTKRPPVETKTETVTEKVDNSAQISMVKQAIDDATKVRADAQTEMLTKQGELNTLQSLMGDMTQNIKNMREAGRDTQKAQGSLDKMVENATKLDNEIKEAQATIERADNTIAGYKNEIEKLENQTRTVTRVVESPFKPNVDTGTYYGTASGYDTAGDSRFGLFDKPTSFGVTSGDKVDISQIKASDESDTRVLDPRYVQFEIPEAYADLYGKDETFTKLVDDTQKKINDYNDVEEKLAQLRLIMSNTNTFIEPRFVDRSDKTVVFTDKDGVIGEKGKDWTAAELSDLFYTDYTKATREAKQDIGKSLDEINSYKKTVTKELKDTSDALLSKSKAIQTEIGELLKVSKGMSTDEIKALQEQKAMIDSQWREIKGLKSTLTTGKLNTDDGVKATEAITKANDTLALSKYFKSDGGFDIIGAVQDGASRSSLNNIGFSDDSVNKVTTFLNDYTQIDGEWYTNEDAKALNDFRDNTYLIGDKYYAKSDVDNLINQYPEQARDTVRSMIFNEGMDAYNSWAGNFWEDYAWATSGYSKKDTNTLTNKYTTADGNIDLDKLYTSGKQDLLNKVQLFNADGSEMSKAEKAELFKPYDETEKYIKSLDIDDDAKEQALATLHTGGLDAYSSWAKAYNEAVEKTTNTLNDFKDLTLGAIWDEGKITPKNVNKYWKAFPGNLAESVELIANNAQRVVDDFFTSKQIIGGAGVQGDKYKEETEKNKELANVDTFDTENKTTLSLKTSGVGIQGDKFKPVDVMEKAGNWFENMAIRISEFENRMTNPWDENYKDKTIFGSEIEEKITKDMDNPSVGLLGGIQGIKDVLPEEKKEFIEEQAEKHKTPNVGEQMVYKGAREITINNIHDLGIIANLTAANLARLLDGNKEAPGELVNLGLNLVGYYFTLPDRIVKDPAQGVAELLSVVVPIPGLPKIASKIGEIGKIEKVSDISPKLVENQINSLNEKRIDVNLDGKTDSNIDSITNVMPKREFLYNEDKFTNSFNTYFDEAIEKNKETMLDQKTVDKYTEETKKLDEQIDNMAYTTGLIQGDMQIAYKDSLQAAVQESRFNEQVADMIEVETSKASPVQDISEAGQKSLLETRKQKATEMAEQIVKEANAIATKAPERIAAIADNTVSSNDNLRVELIRETYVLDKFGDYLNEKGIDTTDLDVKIAEAKERLDTDKPQVISNEKGIITNEDANIYQSVDSIYSMIEESDAKAKAFDDWIRSMEEGVNGVASSKDLKSILQSVNKEVKRIEKDAKEKNYSNILEIQQLYNQIGKLKLLVQEIRTRLADNLGIKDDLYVDIWKDSITKALNDSIVEPAALLQLEKGTKSGSKIDVQKILDDNLKKVDETPVTDADYAKVGEQIAEALDKQSKDKTPAKTDADYIADATRLQKELEGYKIQKPFDPTKKYTYQELIDILDGKTGGNSTGKGNTKIDPLSTDTKTKTKTTVAVKEKQKVADMTIEQLLAELKESTNKKQIAALQKKLQDKLKSEKKSLIDTLKEKLDKAEKELKRLSKDKIKNAYRIKELSDAIKLGKEALKNADKAIKSPKANTYDASKTDVQKKTREQIETKTKTATKLETKVKTDIDFNTIPQTKSPVKVSTSTLKSVKTLSPTIVTGKIVTTEKEDVVDPADKIDTQYRFKPEIKNPAKVDIPKPPTKTDNPKDPEEPKDPNTPKRPGKGKSSNDLPTPKNNPTGQIAWRQGSLKIDGKIRPVWIVLDFKNGKPVKKYVFQTPKGAKIVKRTPKETVYTTGKNVQKTTVEVGNMTVSVDPSSSQVLKFSKKMPNNKAINKMSRGM